MDDIIAVVVKLQLQYQHLEEHNKTLEAVLAAKTKKLEDLPEQVKEKEMDLNAVGFPVHQAEVALAKIQRWVMEQRKWASSKIKLDVGGIQFTMSMTILMAIPDSMLAAMFSGRHEQEG